MFNSHCIHSFELSMQTCYLFLGVLMGCKSSLFRMQARFMFSKHFLQNLASLLAYLNMKRKSEVKWSEVKWSEVKWSEVKWSEVLVAHSYRTLWDPMDQDTPGSSVHGILLGKILEQVAISFSRSSSWPRDWRDPGLLLCRKTFYHLSQQRLIF